MKIIRKQPQKQLGFDLIIISLVFHLITVVIIFQILLTTKNFDPKTDFTRKIFWFKKDVDTMKCSVKKIKAQKSFGPKNFWLILLKKCCQN